MIFRYIFLELFWEHWFREFLLHSPCHGGNTTCTHGLKRHYFSLPRILLSLLVGHGKPSLEVCKGVGTSLLSRSAALTSLDTGSLCLVWLLAESDRSLCPCLCLSSRPFSTTFSLSFFVLCSPSRVCRDLPSNDVWVRANITRTDRGVWWSLCLVLSLLLLLMILLILIVFLLHVFWGQLATGCT